jgi:hypothetical protein
MNTHSLIQFDQQIKIGCAWNSKVGKVIGYFYVKPIKEIADYNDGQIRYLCEFVKLDFIRIDGNGHFTEIANLPKALKSEVNILLGTTKPILKDVLDTGTVIYTERPNT